MDFLTNENILASVVQELRALGHDVISVKEGGKEDPVPLGRKRGRSSFIHLSPGASQRRDFHDNYSSRYGLCCS